MPYKHLSFFPPYRLKLRTVNVIVACTFVAVPPPTGVKMKYASTPLAMVAPAAPVIVAVLVRVAAVIARGAAKCEAVAAF